MARHSARLPSPLALLLGCALLLRALIPAGWMPATEGGLRIELCADFGSDGASARVQREAQRVVDHAMTGAMHRDNGGHPGDDDQSQPCAFASLSAPLLGSDPPPALEPLLHNPSADPGPTLAAKFVVTPHYLLPPLRGPPATG